MRIESTYLFAAPEERVLGALTDPDVLGQILPGCRRLIQLGPPDAGGALTCEAWLRPGPGDDLYVVSGTIVPIRYPARLEVSARGQGPHGPLTVRGSLDLAARDDGTVAAYVWDLDLPAEEPERAPLDERVAADYVQACWERLAALLRAGEAGETSMSEALAVLRADTARGKIVVLPSASPAATLRARLGPTLRGAAWAGVGLIVGLAAITVAAGIIRHWSRGQDGQSRQHGRS